MTQTGGTVLKKFIVFMALFMTLMVPVCAFAFPYSDPAGDFTMEIPEDTGVYYYTPGGTNMSEELLASIQNQNENLALMIASYAADNSLSYSLGITETPLTISAVPEGTGASSDLSAPSVPANVLDVTDFSILNEQQIQYLVRQKEAEFGADYVFDPYSLETINGKTAIVFSGRLAEDNGYTSKIYMVAQNNTNFCITIMYKNDSADTYLNQALLVLNSLQFSTAGTAAATASPSADPAASAAVTPEPTALPTIEPTPTPATGVAGFFTDLGGKIQNAYYSDPNFVFYVIGIAVIIAVVIILILLLKSRKRKKQNGDGGKPPLPEDHVGPSSGSDTPGAPKNNIEEFNDRYQADISRYTQQPDGYDLSDVSRYTQQPNGYNAQKTDPQKPGGYDISDISRYTQQPSGQDLSDVSRYTQQPKGYQKSTAELSGSQTPKIPDQYLNRTPVSANASKAEPPRDSNSPKVGSRAARHRKK